MQTERTTAPHAAHVYPVARTLPGRADSDRSLAVEVRKTGYILGEDETGEVLFDMLNPGTGEIKSFKMPLISFRRMIAEHMDA
jgi:hypothetical protein